MFRTHNADTSKQRYKKQCQFSAVHSTDCGWLVVVGETVFQSISGRLPERVSKKREMIDVR